MIFSHLIRRVNFNIKCMHHVYHTKSGVYGYKGKSNRVPIYELSDRALKNRAQNCKVFQLITAYREHGHKVAKLDPLDQASCMNEHIFPLLNPSTYGLDMDNPDEICMEGLAFSDVPKMKLHEITTLLEKVYCQHIGVELQHLSVEEKEWFAEKFEIKQLGPVFSKSFQKAISAELLKSQAFDKYLAVKFANVKRYGAEGAETMITFFQHIFQQCCSGGVSDVVIGIPHRGRLNLLSVLLNFPPVVMFQKMKGFSEYPGNVNSSGDVLSHLRISTDVKVGEKSVHVSMLPNPSHLEVVCPVVMGKVRSMLQDRGLADYSETESSATQILPIQVHGDASFSGQGIVMETLMISAVPHFNVAGSIHLVVNNQLGFTTPQDYGRSSYYCSDVMKMIGSPIIHVNGYYPEDVVKAAELAFDYRQTFKKDVLVDLICFRRWGHNEMDDPTFTNPVMYKKISSIKSIPDNYCEMLIKENAFTEEEKKSAVNDYIAFLDDNLSQVATYNPNLTIYGLKNENYFLSEKNITKWETGIPIDVLKFVGGRSVSVPEEMDVHPTLLKHIINDRYKKLEEGLRLDWATAEALALGSLILQGFNVRLSGQDVGRGTFSHRHAMITNQSNDEMFLPLNHMWTDQSAFIEVANSILSEQAVLGFEYGFSLNNYKTLVIWEAQFGDFFNCAQVVFDTCISASESKWLLQTGIVILLPHGYDGAGPEHSSCRMERFLQMCDSKEDQIDDDNVNWCIVNPTTPAQYFHLLRRQVCSSFRRPLIVVAPKMLLRHPDAVSTIADMSTSTSFIPVLPDYHGDAENVKKIIFCSGKHFYLLCKERALRNKHDVAIIRVEELCPFPAADISVQIQKYKNATSYVWSQEEHRNMGPWSYVNSRFQNILGCKLQYAGRDVLSTPAVAIGNVHQQEISHVLDDTFDEA